MLQQLIFTPNKFDETINYLKSFITTPPIVLYGATNVAVKVTKFLNTNGFNVSDYFVDDNYVTSPFNTITNVKTFDQIKQKYDRFILIAASGIAISKLSTDKKFKSCSQVLKIVKWDNSFCAFTLPKFNKDYIKENIEKLTLVYEMLTDQLSRDTLIGICNTRLTGNLDYLKSIYESNEYFENNIISLNKNEVFVDGGAYNGDTLKAFIKSSDNQYKKYYAFEPDTANFTNLKKYIATNRLQSIIALNEGLYSTNKTIFFQAEQGLSSAINTNGKSEIRVSTIDEQCTDATFIKMDIEGAETEAIIGAKNTIIKNKPKLAICIYHKTEHLTDIMLLIHSYRKDYKYYMRQHSLNSSDELVLYAV